MDKAIAWFTRIGERNIVLAVLIAMGSALVFCVGVILDQVKETRETDAQHRRELVDCKEQAKQEAKEQYEKRIAVLEDLFAKLEEKTGDLDKTARKLSKRK